MTEAEETPQESTGEPDLSDTELVAEVAAIDESLAAAVVERIERIDALEEEQSTIETELEETRERLEHTRADFRNYKERAKRKQEEIKERATEELIERLLDVRDNLTRALEEETDDVESLREGVKLTRKQFDRVLDGEDVSRIEPDPGDDVDANRHEVMTRVESDRPEGTVASVYRPGYEMAGKVLRPAQVTVSDGPLAKKDDGDGTEGEETRTSEEDTENDAKTPVEEEAETAAEEGETTEKNDDASQDR
ncbi:MAG: nucleotide exchange factor GrpE [Halodesulfurarchaeum sp.]